MVYRSEDDGLQWQKLAARLGMRPTVLPEELAKQPKTF